MAQLPYITDEEATGPVARLYKHNRKLYGRVANAIRVAAHSPKLAQAVFGFNVPLLREEITENLPVRLKALIILKTSMLNGCAH